jgi:glycosyltransferase involved in cell wall biosynthesis
MRLLRPVPLTTRPTVSVVVPCYNYGPLLPAAVASALAQRHVDVEVIVVDDASTDDSREVARRLTEADGRVRLLEHGKNRGHIATYNDGLAAATGDYVALLSADDLLTPGALDRAAALFEAQPDVVMVYGHAERFRGDPPSTFSSGIRSWVVWEGPDWVMQLCRSGTNMALSPEVVLRADVQRTIGGYDPDQPHAGDLHMWLEAASHGLVGYLSGPTQAQYREHETNMHSAVFAADQAAGMVLDLRARDIAFRHVIRLFSDGPAMYAAAREALACEALDLASRAYVWGHTDTWPINELVELAIDLDPDVVQLPAWRAFRRRQRLGALRARRNPAFVPRERVLQHRDAARGARRRRVGV